MDFEKMKRKKLQELCKKHAIPANLTNREMASRLASLLQKPKEPSSHSRSSSNNVEEIGSETNPKDAYPKMKKVRFSPNNEMHIIVCSDSESAASEKRCRRQPSKRSKPSAGGESSMKIVGSSFRRRKSSIRTPAQADKEDVGKVLSPPVGKRQAERLRICVQSENAHNKEENIVSNMRQLRSRAVVVGKNAEVVDGAKVNVGKNGTQIHLKRRKKHGDGLSETGYQDMPRERTQSRKLTRQLKHNAEKEIDPRLQVVESERIETSRRVTRSSFQPVQEAAVVNANCLQGGVHGESVKDSQTKDLPKRQSRNAGKSTASKGLPNEIVPLQNSNVAAERVSDVGNLRRSKRNKTRGGESLISSNEIAPETDSGVSNSQHCRDNTYIRESERRGVRALEEQKKSDQSSDTSKGLGRVGSQLVEGDVYAVPKDDGGDLHDKKYRKRANRILYEKRALEPQADSTCVEELPLRRSRRLTIMTTVLRGGEFQTNLADKMIVSQRMSRGAAFRQDMVANTNIMEKSTEAKEVQEMNLVHQEELPTEELPRQLKRNPSRRQSFAASKKQKGSSRSHTGGDMATPHRTLTTLEALEMSPVLEVLEHENDAGMKCLKEIPDNSSRKEDKEEASVERALQLEPNVLSPVQEILEHENNADMKCLKEIPDMSSRKEDEEQAAVERELQGKKDAVNPSTGNIDVNNRPISPEERDQREIHLNADGSHISNQSSQVLHSASGQSEENSAELESSKRQNKVNCVISQSVPFSAERSNNKRELSVEPVAFTKESENESLLSGEDKSSTKVKLVLEDQFDDLRGTRNPDGNPVDTVDAADNLNDLSPHENNNITCAIGFQHMKLEYGLQSSVLVAEDAVTQSEKNGREIRSSNYSSMPRIRTLEGEQHFISETDCTAGTPRIEENNGQNHGDTLFSKDRTVKAAGKNVNESNEEFQETSVGAAGINLADLSDYPVKGRTIVFEEKGGQISQEEEGGALAVELQSSSKDIEQESMEDISVIFPGQYTNMIEKQTTSMRLEGLGSEKHVPSYNHTAEEANKHEDGWAKLNTIEFNQCSASVSDDIIEEGFHGQEKESDTATVTKAESSVRHSTHPMHYQEDNSDCTAKEDQEERASDVIKDPLSFSQGCMEENVQGTAITQHCLEALDCYNYLEEGYEIPRSGLNSALDETKCPVVHEIPSKHAIRKNHPGERSPVQGGEILNSTLPVHQASSLRTDKLLSGSDKWAMDDSTCEDVATVQMESKSNECDSGNVDFTVLKEESDKENQQLALGEFLVGNEIAKSDTREAMEGNRELSPERRAANASEVICFDANSLELNNPASSELAVKEKHHAAVEAVGLMLNTEIGLGAHHAVSEDNVHPESSKELDLELQEGILEERDVEDVQSLENTCCHVDSSETCFHHVALEDKAVERTQSADQSTQLKTPENKGRGISSFDSDGSQQEKSDSSCLEDVFKLYHNQAGKGVGNIGRTEWTQAHNTAAIKLDRCSLPCVTVDKERCNTVVTDMHGLEDIEDYSTSNHKIEIEKSECGTNGRLSNVAPFSSVKDLRDLGGDVQAPLQCSEEKNHDFDCLEDEDIQLDQHRFMHSYGLSCIDMRTSAETSDGNRDSIIGSTGNDYFIEVNKSEPSEQSLSCDTGNPKMEDTVDVTKSGLALDSTEDARYESDDMVRIEEGIMPRKVDQSPVTAGEESIHLHEPKSDLQCKVQYSMKSSLLAERLEKIGIGDKSKAPTEDTVSNSTGSKSDGNEDEFHIDKLFPEDECNSKEVLCEEGSKEQFLVSKVEQKQTLSSYDLDVSSPMDSFPIESGSDRVMTTKLHGPSKLDGLTDSVSDHNHVTCHADCLCKQGSSIGLSALSSAGTSSDNETELVEGHDKSRVLNWEMNSLQGQFDDSRKRIEETQEKRLEDPNFQDGGNVIVLEFEKNSPLVVEGPENEYEHMKNLEEQEKGLQDLNIGDGGCDVAALEFEENAVAGGLENEDEHKKAESCVHPVAPSNGFILTENLEGHEKRLWDTNSRDGGDAVELEFERNALLVAECPEDEHVKKKAGESVDPIAPSDWFISGEKLEEKEINDFRIEEGQCPEVSGSHEGSVDKINGRDVEGLMEQEAREMTTLFGESELNSGMLNVVETEVRLGSGTDARGTKSKVIKFDITASLGAKEQREEHQMEEEVTEDIDSIENSVDVPDLGDREGSREQDDISAMIQEYMDLEHQKADSGDIFVSQDVEVHDGCSYKAPKEKPIFDTELNQSGEEIHIYSASADTSSLGDGGNSKHSIEQTGHLPTVCTENVGRDLAAMNLSAINDDNVARKSSTKQPKFSSYEKKRSESNLGDSKNVALLTKSATVRRVKSRGNLINKTPKKLLGTLEMKENMPSTKKEQIGSTTATKTLTKRRALEDLQKKPIWK